jgi:hypothetical protein
VTTVFQGVVAVAAGIEKGPVFATVFPRAATFELLRAKYVLVE